MKKAFLIIFVIISNSVFAQNIEIKKIIGTYTDGLGGMSMTKIQLKEDSSFQLKTTDPLFPYTYQFYQNSGKFELINGKVILNPDKAPRNKRVNFNQSVDSNLSDSAVIEINYFIEKFQNEKFIEKEKFNFERITIYINKKRRYYNIVHGRKFRTCGFSRKIKNQIVIDSINQIKIKEKNIKRIGIYTYGFDEILWFKVDDFKTNKFQFQIEQPLDIERMPRRKEIIIKKNKAFFYERNGKIDKSLTPLRKEK